MRRFSPALLVISAIAPAAALASDMAGDQVADVYDVCGQTPLGVPVDANGRPLGDLDLDCDVDQEDFAVFQRTYTGPLGPCTADVCGNGLDDDADCADWDCGNEVARTGGEDCANGIDDDLNGWTDCADFRCTFAPACPGEICDNGIDDDFDAYVDCNDFDCLAHEACQD